MPGDLIFFNSTDHVAMYVGNDLFIHAPHTGDVVRIARLSEYGSPVWGWVRYTQISGPGTGATPLAFTDETERMFEVVPSAEDQASPDVLTFTRG
jgi:hypothetical protein